ncbi:Cationic amino acid transporter 3 [Clonorchis sinensis]|uniref:Cationic amino acid transporter 3 n=1 Tax=Clonorchis sinensis TaxID=79923 RepID=A0A419PRE6_CLOSI|nr:Cationic amino acid transporter 3 [Clonorchis sinensis]
MPRAGSLYIYTYVTFGECAAFCIGWSMVSVMILNASATAKAFSEAVNRLTNGTIRHWSNANLPSLGNSEIFDSTPDLLAMGFLILLALATLSGAYISMTATLVFSGLTVVILIALSVSCFVLGDVNNFHGEGSFLPYGFKGLLEGTLLSIFIISGFEYVANASEEAIDPRRDIPIALVLSILTCTMSNLLISFGIAYVVPHWKISDSLSLIHAFNLTKEPYVSLLAAIGCILAIGPAKIVTMYTISRMLYAISSEGLLFPCLATIDRRTKVPLWSLLVGSVISVVLAGFFNLSTFVQTGAFSALLTYFLVGVQLFLFRYVLEEDVTAIEVDNDNNEHGVPTRKPLTKTHLSKSVCTMRKGVPTFLTRLEGKSWFVGILTVFVGLVLVSGGVINLTQGTTAWIVTGVSEVLVLITAALLCLYRPNEFYGAFQVFDLILKFTCSFSFFPKSRIRLLRATQRNSQLLIHRFLVGIKVTPVNSQLVVVSVERRFRSHQSVLSILDGALYEESSSNIHVFPPFYTCGRFPIEQRFGNSTLFEDFSSN